MKLLSSKKSKVVQSILVFILISTWIFSGWPQIAGFPPEGKTQAAHCTSSPCTITTTETFTVPAGVTSLDITMWGGGSGGGPGQSNKLDRSGGGGGGGAYTECTVAVTAEAGYTVTVGASVGSDTNGNASSFVGNDGTCTANGGSVGNNTGGGAGGAAQVVSGVVTSANAGGTGGSGSNTAGSGGGGGGEGAGSSGTGGAGGNNSGATGGTAGTGTDGGDGGAGGDNTLAGATGTAPGGGGGGAGSQNNTGGNGERGEVTLTWVESGGADPTFSQVAYRWYKNRNDEDVGAAAIMNTPITAPVRGEPIRLRLLFHVSDANLSLSGTTSKLQIATTTDECDIGFSGETYNDVDASAGLIRFFNNSGATDNTVLTDNKKDPHHASSTSTGGEDTVINQTYNETVNFSNSIAAINQEEDGLFDFALFDFAAPAGTRYCFRAVQQGGGELYGNLGGSQGGYGTSSLAELTTAQRVKIRLRGQIRLRIVRLF